MNEDYTFIDGTVVKAAAKGHIHAIRYIYHLIRTDDSIRYFFSVNGPTYELIVGSQHRELLEKDRENFLKWTNGEEGEGESK